MRFRLLSVAAAMLLLGSCAVDELPTQDSYIRAEIADDQTRTSVTDEGIFTWSDGDKIWIQTTSGHVQGTLASGAGTANASFAYGSFVGEMTGRAVYPYDPGHAFSEDVLTVKLPSSYDLGSSLSNNNAAMYGINMDGTLKFSHLAGVVRFSFKDVPAGTDRFTITLDKKINGTFNAERNPEYRTIQTEETNAAAEKTITLNFNALSSKSDIKLYVPLPVGTYNTLDLSLSAGETTVWSYSNAVTNTVNRKSLILMPVVTIGGVIEGEIGADFNPDQYIEYNGTGKTNNTVISGDSYWEMSPFFMSRVSAIDEIELKFQSGGEEGWLFSSERPYVNNGALITSEGLVLRYGNKGENVISNETVITWEEIGLSPTTKMVLKISVSKKTVTVNGKEISVPQLERFTNIGYLFSSYFYVNDDGYAKVYSTMPEGSRLFYAKIWDTNGELVYHGYASQAEDSAGDLQYVWKSGYKGNIFYEFPNTNFKNFWVYSYTNWLDFGGGIESDEPEEYLTIESCWSGATIASGGKKASISVSKYRYPESDYVFYLNTNITDFHFDIPEDADDWLAYGIDPVNMCWIIQFKDKINLGFSRSTTLALRSAKNPSVYVEFDVFQEGMMQTMPDISRAVDLSAAGTANCYIVNKAGHYCFTPAKGNSNESVGTISGMIVLWESFGTTKTPDLGDLIAGVMYSDGKIVFATNDSFKEGNAVIAALDKNKAILWSWHIWLTDQPKEQIYYNNAGTLMDRNLGATSSVPGENETTGLMYQWGRKDPFPGLGDMKSRYMAASGHSIWFGFGSEASGPATGTIEWSTANPMIFITGNKNNSDWYFSTNYNTDQTRWSAEKTVYDPCPAGWKVPDGGEDNVWAKAIGSSTDHGTYVNDKYGREFSGAYGDDASIWYPATGYLKDYDKEIGEGSWSGYYWTNAAYSNNGHSFNSLMISAYSNDYYHDYNNYGSEALPVRCMKIE